MTREEIDQIEDIIHKTIYKFFDVCDDNEEVPMTKKDKLLLEVNKAICNNIKTLEQEPIILKVNEKQLEELIELIHDNPLCVATAEPKTGRWIDIDSETYTWKIRCDQCGHERSMMSTQGKYPNFCEECGTDMRGGA